MLHNDQPLFEQVILRVSEDTGIEASIIEKNYYVTLFLQRIVTRLPNIIFKGGTSLSKCYKLINRFSEDIDLNIETDTHPTEGQRKKLKEAIVSIIDELGFTLTNPDNVRSRRDYNRYIADYPTLFPTSYLKEHLIVETAVYIKAYPCKRMLASSLIYDYLERNGYTEMIEQYSLQPFVLNVQSAERTLIDKVFALGDYYLSDVVYEHSRHVYDIYKLLGVVTLNDSMKQLVQSVREERMLCEIILDLLLSPTFRISMPITEIHVHWNCNSYSVWPRCKATIHLSHESAELLFLISATTSDIVSLNTFFFSSHSQIMITFHPAAFDSA